MYRKNDNRKERGVSLREPPRHNTLSGTGNAPQDGFTRISRRPRVRFTDEIMSIERADRMERVWDNVPTPDYEDY